MKLKNYQAIRLIGIIYILFVLIAIIPVNKSIYKVGVEWGMKKYFLYIIWSMCFMFLIANSIFYLSVSKMLRNKYKSKMNVQ